MVDCSRPQTWQLRASTLSLWREPPHRGDERLVLHDKHSGNLPSVLRPVELRVHDWELWPLN